MLKCERKAIHRSVSALARLSRQVGLRHERLHRGLARGNEDLRLPVGDVASHHPVGHIGTVLHDEPVEKSGGAERTPCLRPSCQSAVSDVAR